MTNLKAVLEEIWNATGVTYPAHLVMWSQGEFYPTIVKSKRGTRVDLKNRPREAQKKRIEESYASKQTHEEGQHREKIPAVGAHPPKRRGAR